MRNYLLKINFKFNLQKHHFAHVYEHNFVYVYEVIIKCYVNFITCLYFPFALITWNSSHCHQMELFKSKESGKKIWFKQRFKNCMAKNHFRVTSIFKIIIRICMRNVEFYRKTSTFLPKRCLFIFFIFHFNEKELNQNACLVQYVENETSNSSSHKKEKKREGIKNVIQLQKHFYSSWKIFTSYTSY